MPSTMRAAFVTEVGPAEAIRVDQLPVPARGPTDVLVAIETVAVNQVDTFIRSGRWPTPMPFPFVVGRDLVGTVVEAEPVTGFGPGDRVWCNSLGHGGRQGACAEYAVVPADRLYRLPGDVDAAAAVAAFHPAATAYLGLHHRARVRAGDIVLVGGAAGSVGSCVVQFAAAAGAMVIGTARPDDHKRCHALGATHVIDYADPDLAAQVRAVAPSGVDLSWDTSGKGELLALAGLTAPGGRIVVTAGRDPQPPTPLWPLYTNDLSVVGFVISRATATELADAAAAINRRLDGLGFDIPVSQVRPLDETPQAHALVESGHRGRIVIRPAAVDAA